VYASGYLADDMHFINEGTVLIMAYNQPQIQTTVSRYLSRTGSATLRSDTRWRCPLTSQPTMIVIDIFLRLSVCVLACPMRVRAGAFAERLKYSERLDTDDATPNLVFACKSLAQAIILAKMAFFSQSRGVRLWPVGPRIASSFPSGEVQE